MTDLAAACGSLIRWLPQARALIAEPDQDGSTVALGAKPGSAPPWNPAVANVVLDIHEGTRRLEASVRLAVAGHPGTRRGGSDANTVKAMRAIASLGHALEEQDAATAGRLVTRWVMLIQQLPAIDEIPVLDRIHGGPPCPYCEVHWLMVARQSGMVTCGVDDCLHCDRCREPCGRKCECGGTGRRWWARVEMGRLGPVMVWPDGTIQ